MNARGFKNIFTVNFKMEINFPELFGSLVWRAPTWAMPNFLVAVVVSWPCGLWWQSWWLMGKKKKSLEYGGKLSDNNWFNKTKQIEWIWTTRGKWDSRSRGIKQNGKWTKGHYQNNQRQSETRGKVYNRGQTGLTVARVSVDKELLRKLSCWK